VTVALHIGKISRAASALIVFAFFRVAIVKRLALTKREIIIDLVTPLSLDMQTIKKALQILLTPFQNN
jgi:hypothetical protein